METSRRVQSMFMVWLSVAALILLIAGCTSPAPTPTPTPTVAPKPTPQVNVKTASKAGIGDYLVDAKGLALYYFTKDTIGKGTATGAVLAAWPIFYAEKIVVPSGLKTEDFTTITRADGLKQTAYKGWALYYFAKDQASGDTLGEGVGGIWFVLKQPFYSVMLQTKTDLGNYLVDSKSMTLYYFTKDSPGVSTAVGDTLKNWPIFSADPIITVSTVKAADFGTITRSDGLKQSTYKSYPLYYYAQDKASGDTLGQGVGGFWYVIDPAKFAPATATPTTPPVISGGGYGGY